jgi:hypothetical protein
MLRRFLPALLTTLGLTAPAAAEVSYTKDIKPFLATYCAECHSAARPRSGVSVESYDALVKGRGSLVVPGQPDRSNLLRITDPATARKIMPPRKFGKKPTAEELAMVKAWIAAGAKDDSAPAGETQAQRQQDSPPLPGKAAPPPGKE